MLCRSPMALLGIVEAIAGTEPTHTVRRRDDGGVLFRGTEAQCTWVKEGFDQDLLEGHPDAQGETYVKRIVEE